MQKSVLIKLLRSLKDDEMKRLNEFLISPFHNKSKKIIELFRHLRKFHPDYDSEKLDKKFVFEAMYGAGKYNYGVLNNLIHELYVHCERFLLELNIEKKRNDLLLYTIEEMLDRDLITSSKRNIEILEKSLDEQNQLESDHYLKKFMSEKLKYEYFNSISKTKLPDAESIETHIKSAEYLDKFSLLENFDIYSYLYSISVVKKIQIPFELDKKVKDFFKANMESGSPEIAVKAYTVMINFENADESLYYEAKNLMNKYSDYLKCNPTICYNYFAALQRYIRAKELSGDYEKYTREMLDIYKKMLEYDSFRHYNNFPAINFKNILTLSLRLKDFEWAEEFYNSYKEKLHPDMAVEIEKLYAALSHFEMGQFEQSLECISRMDPGDEYNKLWIKNLQIRNNYELKRFADLTDALNTYYKFLRSSKFSDRGSLPVMKFLKFVKELSNANFGRSKSDIEYLKEKILKEETVISRKWLLEKVEELI